MREIGFNTTSIVCLVTFLAFPCASAALAGDPNEGASAKPTASASQW